MEQGERYPKLEHQPLTLVLAEFRFKRVEFETQALAVFKERLAPLFPERFEGVVQQVQVGDGGVTIATAPYINWRAPLAGVSLHLEADRITYATTMYPRFKGFLRDCLVVVEALRETLRPATLHRVGLRYNDVVVPMQDESLEHYVYAPLLPYAPLSTDDSAVVRHLSETLVQTSMGALVVRALTGMHGLGMMPDLQEPFGLPLGIEVSSDRATAVLDFDHFWEVPEMAGVPFSVEAAASRLAELHEPAREAFWKVTTDFARTQRWK